MSEYVEYQGLRIYQHPHVYTPREDSFLMVDALKESEESGKNFLEIGCGSGFISLSIKSPEQFCLATDINYEAAILALKNARANNDDNLHVVCSSLSKCFRKNGVPTLIIFNPPYLPEDPEIDPYTPRYEHYQLVGGKKGDEVILDAINELNPSTHVLYCIISSLATNPVEFSQSLPAWNVHVIKTLYLDFETIWVLRLGGKI